MPDKQRPTCERMDAGPILYSTTRYKTQRWHATVTAPGTEGPDRVGMRLHWLATEPDDINFGLIPAPQFGSVPVSNYFNAWYLRSGVPRVWVPRTLTLTKGSTAVKDSVFTAVMEPFLGKPAVTNVAALELGGATRVRFDGAEGQRGFLCVGGTNTTGRLLYVKLDREGRLRRIAMLGGQRVRFRVNAGDLRMLPFVRAAGADDDLTDLLGGAAGGQAEAFVSSDRPLVAMSADYLDDALRIYADAPGGGALNVTVSAPAQPREALASGRPVTVEKRRGSLVIPLRDGRNTIQVRTDGAPGPVLDVPAPTRPDALATPTDPKAH
jgi:hypothetical protein